MFKKKKETPVKPSAEKASIPVFKRPSVRKAIGLALLVASASVFVQGLPLMYIFIGVYMGVPTDTTMGNMDSMVWLLTSVTLSAIAVYGFVKWMKFLFNRFVKKAPAALKVLDGKGKRAHG